MHNKEDLAMQVNIGMNAAKLLRDELLVNIFYSKKTQACEQFMGSQVGEDRKRRELWRSVQGVLEIEQELQNLIDSGNLAKDQLKLLEEQERLSNSNVHNFFGDSE